MKKQAIDTICYKSDPLAAIKEAQADMMTLFRGDVSPVHMSLTQKLSKDPKKYKTKTPAVALAERRMELDPTDVVSAGEFMKYVLCDYSRLHHDINKHHKRKDQVVDPAEAMVRDVPLDLKNYKTLADNQLYRLFHYPLRAFLCKQSELLPI